MPVKITRKFNTFEKFRKVSSIFTQLVHSFIGATIKDLILKGTSPVKGYGRFQKYSESYLKAIDRNKGDFVGKKKSPVNLYLSGDMMASMKVTKDDKKVVVEFGSEVASYHNEQGAGRKKVIRRLLPTGDGETFNREIMKRIRDALKQAVNLIARS